MARSFTNCTVHFVTVVKVMNPRNKRWAGHVEHTGHGKCIDSLFGKTVGERPMGRTRCRWKDACSNVMWCSSAMA